MIVCIFCKVKLHCFIVRSSFDNHVFETADIKTSLSVTPDCKEAKAIAVNPPADIPTTTTLLISKCLTKEAMRVEAFSGVLKSLNGADP